MSRSSRHTKLFLFNKKYKSITFVLVVSLIVLNILALFYLNQLSSRAKIFDRTVINWFELKYNATNNMLYNILEKNDMSLITTRAMTEELNYFRNMNNIGRKPDRFINSEPFALFFNHSSALENSSPLTDSQKLFVTDLLIKRKMFYSTYLKGISQSNIGAIIDEYTKMLNYFQENYKDFLASYKNH